MMTYLSSFGTPGQIDNESFIPDATNWPMKVKEKSACCPKQPAK